MNPEVIQEDIIMSDVAKKVVIRWSDAGWLMHQWNEKYGTSDYPPDLQELVNLEITKMTIYLVLVERLVLDYLKRKEVQNPKLAFRNYIARSISLSKSPDKDRRSKFLRTLLKAKTQDIPQIRNIPIPIIVPGR